MKKLFQILMVLVLLVSFLPGVELEASTWRDFTTGRDLLVSGKADQAIPYLKRAANSGENASYYRQLAIAYEETNQYQRAADTLYKEADLHYKKAQATGDMNTYFATLHKADQLNSEIDLFLEEKAKTTDAVSLEKYEPESGMYIGAYLMDDDPLKPYGRERYDAFNDLTGKQHSTFFTYYKYGEPFPELMSDDIRDAGAGYHIALQPEQGLSVVKDDAYLRQFARDAYQSGMPIFLRFAAEMNGKWTPWHGNPAEYIRAFRTVYQVMKEEAPNVALVWSPSEMPRDAMHDYYPGDAYVDWVGVSIYSSFFTNGDINQPNEGTNPLDSLDYIYEHYADQKPIMVSEFAATHYSEVGRLDTTDFAVTKMNMLYQGARLKYPRVKSIQWFSMNAIEHAIREERKLNNYSLTENQRLLNEYKQTISHPYYLTAVENGTFAENTGALAYNVTPFESETIRETLTVQAFAKTYDPNISKISFYLDNQLFTEKTAFPYAVTIDPNGLSTGKHTLRAVAFDSKGRKAVETTSVFYTGNKVMPAENELVLFVNDKKAYRKDHNMRLLTAPTIVDNRTLVPLRFISESFGAEVKWDGQTKSITIMDDAKELRLQLGKAEIRVNGTSKATDIAPKIINGTTLVPIRVISENLGASIAYEQADKKISITR
jgi:beta-mannanase